MTTGCEAVTESEWKDLATTEITHLTDEEKDYLPAAWDAWLARVKRDAAREALDGLADAHRRHASESDQAAASDVHSIVASQALHYRDTHYPEQED